MDKAPVTKDEIERLLTAELHTFLGCEEALQVVVVSIENNAKFIHARSLVLTVAALMAKRATVL